MPISLDQLNRLFHRSKEKSVIFFWVLVCFVEWKLSLFEWKIERNLFWTTTQFEREEFSSKEKRENKIELYFIIWGNCERRNPSKLKGPRSTKPLPRILWQWRIKPPQRTSTNGLSNWTSAINWPKLKLGHYAKK